MSLSLNGSVIFSNLSESSFVVPDVVVQQFTGLYDKNGREIYEGDIISYTQHLFNTDPDKFLTQKKEVKWDELLGKWNVYETNAGESDIVVIGNIFENTELIK